MTCDYADCNRPAVTKDDGWQFCRPHYGEHRADLHGETWPHMQPASDLRQDRLMPCGTSAAYRRHSREGTTPCEACRAAETGRRNWLRPSRGKYVGAA